MEFRKQEGTISFEEAERRHAELKRRYEAGLIGDEQFDTERQRLVVMDDEGRSWAMSRHTGRWLYHDGNAWIEATPPTGPLASPPGPSPDGEGVALEKTPSQDSPEDPRIAGRERHCPGCGAAVGSKSTFCASCGEYVAPQVEAPLVPEMSPGDSSEGGARRGNKAPLVLALGALGFVMVAVVGLVGYYFLWPVEAPALEGRTLASARQQVGGDFELVSTEGESGEPKGTIVRQEPTAGTGVGRGGEISVVVSNGMVTLPDVVGMTETAAENALTSRAFEVETRTRESSRENAGQVVYQFPSDDEAEEGSEVAIVVGEAPPPEQASPPEEASGPAPGYDLIEDPTGALTIEAPSSWDVLTGGPNSEVRVGHPGSWSTLARSLITSSITTADSMDAWTGRTRQPSAGAYVVASRELARYADDDLLYAGPFTTFSQENCDAGPYEDYDRGPYSGKMQTWFDCGGGTQTAYSLAAAPEGRECVVLLSLMVPDSASESDHEAAQHILDTFEVDCGDVAATSEEDGTIEFADTGETAPPG